MSKEAACAKYNKWMKWQVAISEQGYAQNLSLWKWLLFAWDKKIILISMPSHWASPKTEALGNSEMAY